MKRLTILVALILTALCDTLTAFAADASAVNAANISGNAVTVSVTAQADCALFVGVYDQDGRLLSVQARDVGAGGSNVSVSIPGGVPAGAAVKTFLTGADSRPLCPSVTVSGRRRDADARSNANGRTG